MKNMSAKEHIAICLLHRSAVYLNHFISINRIKNPDDEFYKPIIKLFDEIIKFLRENGRDLKGF
jgi:hypothetical protein